MFRDPLGKMMNGTRSWCTLVDVHPEAQTSVRKSDRVTSLARYSWFLIPPQPCPARSSLTSPGAVRSAPHGASLFVPPRGGQWESRGVSG